MLPDGLFQLLGVIVTTAGTTWGTIYLANRSKRSTDQATAAGMLKEVWAEMGNLKAEMTEMRGQIVASNAVVRICADFIDRLGVWFAMGGKGHRPQPPTEIHQYVNAALWADPEGRGERT